jgi:hypothetical protein
MESSEYERRLRELELSIERLRALYEQYFRGIEKTPPAVLKKKVERELREMRKVRHRNTATRFRLQMQVQKYTTYLTYWQRIMRDIEAGRIKRSPAGLRRGRAEGASRPASFDVPEPPREPGPGARPSGEDEELLDIDIDIEI